MNKKTFAIECQVDEVSLSLRGWEIINPRARLSVEEYAEDSEHRVTFSGELHFHPEDWVVRTNQNDEYLPTIHAQLMSVEHGAMSAPGWLSNVYTQKEMRRPLQISESFDSWWEADPHDAGDLYLSIGVTDWEHIASTIEPSSNLNIMLPEIVDQRRLNGIGVSIHTVEVKQSIDDHCLFVSLSLRHPIGDIRSLVEAAANYSDWMVDLEKPPTEQADFTVYPPQVDLQLFDESGFLLETREFSAYGHLQVDHDRQFLNWNPTSMISANFDLNDLAGEVSRIVVRISDPVE